MTAVSYWLLLLNWGNVTSGFDVVTPLSGMAFSIVGWAIHRQRPRHRIGWTTSVLGLGMVVAFWASEYGIFDALESPLPIAGFVVHLGAWAGSVVLPAIAALALLYPRGESAGWIWRLGLALAGFTWALFLITAPMNVVNSWRYVDVGLEPVAELALAGPLIGGALASGMDIPALNDLAYLIGWVAILAGACQIVVRYVRSRGIERLQIKWLAYVLVVGFGLLGTYVAWEVPAANEAGAIVLMVGAPVAIGVAITRHGLYEINRLISRTVSYALVVGILAAAVASLATLVGAQFQQPWIVATATLGVAAVFNPLRKRVRRGVDRRFNRSRYDAERVMDEFSASIRNRVDSEEVTVALLHVVSTTMQPTAIGVWIRE